MATEGANEELPPPIQTLATPAIGGEAKCEFNMDNLSRPELLTLLSIMEGELEARDLVIEALRARRKDVFIQEHYGRFNLTDPFLALQRDNEAGEGEKERRAVSASPVSVLEAVMVHCRKMQERMSAQLVAAEGRQKKLELEKLQLQSLEQEQRKLSAQLKDERQKNKHIVMMLVRECKQLVARLVEEGQRFDDLSARLEEEGQASARLQEELAAERSKAQKMEAEMEKQLSEMDTEREQLRSRARTAELRAEKEYLQLQLSRGTAVRPRATASVCVGTEATSGLAVYCQTDDPVPTEGALAISAKTAATGYAGMNLPKSQNAPRALVHNSSGGPLQTENGPTGAEAHPSFIAASSSSSHSLHSHGSAAALPAVSPRVQAARNKFQASPSEQDQNGTASQSSLPRDVSPTSRDNFTAKQQARHTVTQVLSRFTSPQAAGALRPGLPHSASEGGPFPTRLSHPQIGLKSPTVGRIDRGNPPPIPPKKPGLSQTPSPPHPPIKVVSEGSRSPSAGLGVATKPATPQLPPKPAVDLAGAVGGCPIPALAKSQVGACPLQMWGLHQAACAECRPVTTTIVSSSSLNPVSASSHRPCDTDSSLATASGWCPTIVPSLTSGDPVPLADGRTLLLQAATQGNVTLLSMLLNRDPTDISPFDEDGKTALYSAAENGHADCVKLLLTSGASLNVPDKNGFNPLHAAAAHGHFRCLEVLLGCTVDVEETATGGRTALFLASGSGNPECVRALLDAGADRTLVTVDGWTTLHAAVNSGHVGCLEQLLRHPSPGSDPVPLGALLNHVNADSWTAAHIAASKGFKKCLELLCSHSEQNLDQKDKCHRTVHDVATDDCKDLLENLESYKVQVRIHRGSEEQICPVDPLVGESTVGTITVHICTGWGDLARSLDGTLSAHLHLLCGGWDSRDQDTATESLLGLSSSSISSVLIGDAVWLPGQELSRSPWDLVRKPHCQHVTVKLKGLLESSLEELTYESLIPLHLLQNYVRLVEQYHNVIFHGLEGSCQEYLSCQIAHCIKHKQEAMGISCDVVRVQVDENLSKEQLLEKFVNCGFLIPVRHTASSQCVVVLLEGLERAQSLSELLGNLCEGLENRGSVHPFSLLHAQEACGLYHFPEGSFLIGTLSKSRLHGPELLLQQHFRWVQLRWDLEPLSRLLGRYLRMKLVHKMKGQVPAEPDLLCRTVFWVGLVWRQLNSCLSFLGTPQALIGPQVFFSCPVVLEQAHVVIKWLSKLWNAVVVPRVEEAIVSQVMMKRSPALRPSPSRRKLTPGQQAVVKATLAILLHKAILQGCPMPRPEIDKYLSEFHGSSFPLSVFSSYQRAGMKGRESGVWRKASTSPRQRIPPAPTWSSCTTLREGSRSSPNMHFSRINTNSQEYADGDATRFSLGSDDEMDLMKELQDMCTSKSEPDISRITHCSEDFVSFPDSLSGQSDSGECCPSQPQTTTGRCHSNCHVPGPINSEKRVTRPKSQLPVPSSKSLPRANSAPQTRGSFSKTVTSSRRRELSPHGNTHQSHTGVWVLHRDSSDDHDNQ